MCDSVTDQHARTVPRRALTSSWIRFARGDDMFRCSPEKPSPRVLSLHLQRTREQSCFGEKQQWQLCGDILACGSATKRLTECCCSRAVATKGSDVRRDQEEARSQAVCLVVWQPPTLPGTCNAKPRTFLKLVRKLKMCEETLTYNQFGLSFYQSSSFKSIQYQIKTSLFFFFF